MFSRRQVLKGLVVAGIGSVSFGGYALAEPFRLGVTRYAISPPDWPRDLALKLAVLADFHVCEPWFSLDRLRHIVQRTNALEADAILLLGDFVVGHRLEKFSRAIAHEDWARVLAGLKAPLGVHAVLGNHDWWEDIQVQRRRAGPVPAQVALEDVGLPVYQNDVLRLVKDGAPFWLAGLGDQWAFWPRDGKKKVGGVHAYEGVDDLPGTLAKITDDAPVVLMVHEPDIFPDVPDRVALTVAGHTHGGQVRFAGYAPIVPSRFGQRYLQGHIIEDGRHLVVSGGLGCSSLPIRFGVPPEIVLIELGSAPAIG
ncbi:metallophosphoesterase [Hyphomicrobium sp.]|uniref:metallophosphoesterase n=1 Tax=Hyphomicrobium sp. TaxID=82 RepID=UPI002BC02A0E|nr:metallophosphoesterase [Hyphomicrobium sp.]HRN89737.1 metallophosphoesterase [Hyphomicrobium sp.]HRQ27175.1 metallophosphoesterase [Hyphomicrobium sp.]